jgi:radical SAM superfamily enzyme YgiQ (UPF0313 family)
MVLLHFNFVSLFLQVEIMIALEKKFSITLDEENAKKFITVQDVVDRFKLSRMFNEKIMLDFVVGYIGPLLMKLYHKAHV